MEKLCSRLKKLLRFCVSFIIVFNNLLYSSGAYDNGTATGKANWQISLTLNPFNLIPYGQNYGVLSYGLTDRSDIVSYYAEHNNGSKSIYYGLFNQFIDIKGFDIGSAIGLRYNFNRKNSYDLFFPQLLYNYMFSGKYSVGGSVVKVFLLKNNNLINEGRAIDITFYKKLLSIQRISTKIVESYFGIGIFKNTGMKLFNDTIYFHYSLDIKFKFEKY